MQQPCLLIHSLYTHNAYLIISSSLSTLNTRRREERGKTVSQGTDEVHPCMIVPENDNVEIPSPPLPQKNERKRKSRDR